MAIEDDIKKYYPNLAWAINIPGLRDLLSRAVNDKGSWDDAKFQSELRQTDWWKTTSPSDRTYQETLSKDPAQIRESEAGKQAEVWDKARQLGVALTGDQVVNLVQTANKFGYNSNQIVDQIIEVARKQGYQGNGDNQNMGMLANTMATFKKSAANYLVNVDDKTAFNWATTVANGEHSAEDYDSLMRDWAKARFSYDPQMTKQIEAGFTPAQLLQPQRAKIAQLLEVDQSAVNLMDNKWSKVLDYADQGGTRRVATESETAQIARSTAEWRKTLNGQQAGAQMAGNISRLFYGR